MRIVHINLFDEYGGAARVASQLIAFSRKQGHTVHQFVFRYTKKEDPYTIPISPMPNRLMQAFNRCEQQTGINDYFMPYLMSVVYHPVYRQADVVHLHCIHGGYFSVLFLPFIGNKKLVWTLHDTTAYTAHCLYPHLCQQWQNDYCTECPLDKEVTVRQNRKLLQKIKEDIIKITPMKVVAPSKWIADMAGEGIFRTKVITRIYNGVDTSIYYPRDKAEMRAKLNLPQDKFILMFAAHGGIASEMKGGQHAINVLIAVQKKHPNVVFLHVGSPSNEVPTGITMETYTFPYIEDEIKMAELYAAADLFLSTSLTESFGLTVAESMACGTPAAAFAAGGLKEIIEEEKSGWLVPLRDEKALAKVIGMIIKNRNNLPRYNAEAIKRIQKNFAIDRCCKGYEELYRGKE